MKDDDDGDRSRKQKTGINREQMIRVRGHRTEELFLSNAAGGEYTHVTAEDE